MENEKTLAKQGKNVAQQKVNPAQPQQQQVKQTPQPQTKQTPQQPVKQTPQQQQTKITPQQQQTPQTNVKKNEPKDKSKVTMSFASNTEDKSSPSKLQNKETKIESANKGFLSEFMVPNIEPKKPITTQSSKPPSSSKKDEPPKYIDQAIITKTLNQEQNTKDHSSNTIPSTFEAKKSKLSPINPNQKHPQEIIEPKKIDLPKQNPIPSYPSNDNDNLIPDDEPDDIEKDKTVINVTKNPQKDDDQLKKKPKVKVEKSELEMLMDEEFGPQDQDEQNEQEDEKPSSNNGIKFSNFNLDVKQKEKQFMNNQIKQKENEDKKIISTNNFIGNDQSSKKQLAPVKEKRYGQFLPDVQSYKQGNTFGKLDELVNKPISSVVQEKDQNLINKESEISEEKKKIFEEYRMEILKQKMEERKKKEEDYKKTLTKEELAKIEQRKLLAEKLKKKKA